MTTATLRAVTLKTVANYAQAAERAVLAYRVGGQRLIAAMQRGVDLAAQRSPERLAGALRRAGGNVSGLAGMGLEALSSRTERAIEISSTGMSSQVRRVADLADGVDIPVVSTGLQAAARISLPGAQAALALSQRVVAGASKLPGSPVDKAGAKVRATVARARKAAQPQAPVDAVVAQVSKRVTKARKAAAPVVAELAAAIKPKAARKPAAQPITVKASVKAAAKPVQAAVKATTARVRRAAKAQPVAAAVAAVQDALAA